MRQQVLISPGPHLDWEVWALSGQGGQGAKEALRFGQKVADPAPTAASAGPRAIVALPVCQCLTFALWLTQADPALHEQMILSQLEKRGLASRSGAGAVFDYAVIAQVENRMLVRVTLLPANFPAALCFPKAQSYLLFADVLPLPENRITIWQERENLVLVATRGSEPVYTQVLGRGAGLIPQIAHEIATIRLALEVEQTVEKIEGVTLWGEFPGSGGDGWEALSLPLEETVLPPPSAARLAAAVARSRLLPLPLQAARRASSRRNRNARLAVIAGVGYLALVFLLWIYLRTLQGRGAKLGESVMRDKPAAAALERTAACWRTIEPATNPKLYPIEQFYQCTRVLPAVGIRFATFETRGTGIRIKGTARNAPAIYRFFEQLKKNRDLANYRWNLGQPKLQKDDTAEFKIEGSLLYGPVK